MSRWPNMWIVYKDIGVNIDCYASSTDDGRFNVQITFGDSSVISLWRSDRGAGGERTGLRAANADAVDGLVIVAHAECRPSRDDQVRHRFERRRHPDA